MCDSAKHFAALFSFSCSTLYLEVDQRDQLHKDNNLSLMSSLLFYTCLALYQNICVCCANKQEETGGSIPTANRHITIYRMCRENVIISHQSSGYSFDFQAIDLPRLVAC